jgi:2-phosphoglycerate kinase
MNRDRNWTVLFIGGASGMGKSSVAYELARIYNVNVMEVDDICQAVKAVTTIEILPAIHYWSTGINWQDIGVRSNVKWLIDVSKEMIPAIKAIVNNHIESDVPVIIEGDFIHPELAASFENPKVKYFYIYEPNRSQILQNYFTREGGELQHFRTDISAEYGDWLVNTCKNKGIKVIESRPWNTVVERIIESILY